MSSLKKTISRLDTEEKIALYQQLYSELEEEERSRLIAESPSLKPLADYFEKAIETMRAPGKITGISTGYPRLDFLTMGFDPDEMIVIAGPTGKGKTMLSQNILYNMARAGIPSLFFSLEMSEIETTQRFIVMNRSEGGGAPLVAKLPIIYYAGRADLRPESIEVQVAAAIENHGVKIVCIDHIHYFARSITHEREEIDLISRTVKQVARKYKIPIILISHVRKLASDDDFAHMVDLKGTSAIAQDADQVIMVNRKSLDPSDLIRRTLVVSVEKNRLKGRGGETRFMIDHNWRLKEQEFAQVAKLAEEIYGSA